MIFLQIFTLQGLKDFPGLSATSYPDLYFTRIEGFFRFVCPQLLPGPIWTNFIYGTVIMCSYFTSICYVKVLLLNVSIMFDGLEVSAKINNWVEEKKECEVRYCTNFGIDALLGL